MDHIWEWHVTLLQSVSRSILFSAADINGDGRLDHEEFGDILADPMDPWIKKEKNRQQ